MLSIQAAKDTFYMTLRDRIAAANPGRTVVVRGVVRPSVVVAENELPGAGVDGIPLADTFCIRWTKLSVDPNGASVLVTLGCEVRYATDGSASSAGLDRGRLLAAMDSELAAAVEMAPQSVAAMQLTEVAGGGELSSVATGATVFWCSALFKPAVMRGERMERTVEIEVFAYGS